MVQGIPERHRYYLLSELVGSLDLSDFVNLKELIVFEQKITSLNLADCSNLKDIYASFNLIERITLPRHTLNLERVSLTNNNIQPQNLSCFSNFINLRYLYLGVDGGEKGVARLREGIYNRWYGTLEHLKDLEFLEELAINSTDIDSGLEHLPTDGLNFFVFGDCGRTEAGVNRLKEVLEIEEELAVDEDTNNNSWKVGIINQMQEDRLNAVIQQN
jgi:hypothetical protein